MANNNSRTGPAAGTVTTGVTVCASINGPLDKDPPIVTSGIVAGGADNAFASYDTQRRRICMALTAEFP